MKTLSTVFLLFLSIYLFGCSSTTSTFIATQPSIKSSNPFADGTVKLVDYEAHNATESEAFDEYKKNQAAFDAINITAAWAKGANGNGTVIGIMDTEVYNGYEFIGKNLTHISQLDVNGTIYALDPTKLYNENSHGSYVAAIAAGNFDAIRKSTTNILDYQRLLDSGMVGVAYGASIVDLPILSLDCAEMQGCHPGGDIPTAPFTSIYLPQRVTDYFNAAFTAILSSDAKFVNMSWGYLTTLQAILDNGAQSNTSIVEQLSSFIVSMSQTNRAEQDKSVFVISTGNYYNSWAQNQVNYANSPTILSTLPEIAPELDGLIIAAAALNSDSDRDDLSFYSNRCGIAKDYCVAAPGTVYSNAVYNADQQYNSDGNYIPIESGNITHGWSTVRGTSFAAPIITGALAVIDDYFNGTLSAKEVGQRLLITADNTTCPADVCGRGIINVGAALDPVGALSLKFGKRTQKLDHWGNPLAGEIPLLTFSVNTPNIQVNPLLSLTVAENSALVIDQVSNQNVMFLDELNAPFYVSFKQALTISQHSGQAIYCQNNCAAFNQASNNFRLSYSDTIIYNDDYHFQYQLGEQGNRITLKKSYDELFFGFGLSLDAAFLTSTEIIGSEPDLAYTLKQQGYRDFFQFSQNTDKEDLLTMQVANGFNALRMDICLATEFQCTGLQYEFRYGPMHWLMRLTHKEHLENSLLANVGVQLQGVLGYTGKNNNQQTMNLGYRWKVTELLEFNAQFNSMDLLISETGGNQKIMSSGNFQSNQIKVDLSVTWNRQLVTIGFQNQIDTSGYLSYELPSSRTITGDISFREFDITFQPRIEKMLTVQYELLGQASYYKSSKFTFVLDYLQAGNQYKSAIGLHYSYPLIAY